MEIQDQGMPLEEGMNRLPQDPFSLSVNNPHIIDPLVMAGPDVFIHHRGRIFGFEHMQVEVPV